MKDPPADELYTDELHREHAGHNIALHDHEPSWCSRRYRCETCHTWVNGPPCQVAGTVRHARQKPW
jgi:hypothetical protein